MKCETMQLTSQASGFSVNRLTLGHLTIQVRGASNPNIAQWFQFTKPDI